MKLTKLKIGKGKGKRKKLIFAGVAVVLVIAIAAVAIPRVLKTNQALPTTEATVISATASLGDISTTIESSGSISTSDSVSVTVPDGIEIESVLVSVGQEVAEGDELATLNELSVKATYYTLTEQLEELEDAQDDTDDDEAAYYTLAQDIIEVEAAIEIVDAMLDDLTLVSPSSGIIGTIYEDSSATTTSTTYESSVIGISATESTDAEILFLSATTDESSSDSSGSEGTTTSTTTSLSDIYVPITVPTTGEGLTLELPDDDNYYYDATVSTITWNSSDVIASASTIYQASVTLVLKDGYTFTDATIPWVYSGTTSDATLGTKTTENDTMTFTVTYAATSEAVADTTTPSDSSSGSDSGSDSSSTTAPSATAEDTASSASQSTTQSASSGTSSVSSSSTSSSSGSTDDSSTTSSSTTSSSVSYVDVLTLESCDTMELSLSLDELDILSVELGQKVYLTFTALTDTVIEGEVSEISYTGTNEGGTTKYSVTVSVPKEDQMLSGMSVSASIVISESTDLLMIPSAAVTNIGTESYVYTGYDESTGEFTGETLVVTDVADGTYVSVIEGLSEGDTIYYSFITTSSDSEATDMLGSDMLGSDMMGSDMMMTPDIGSTGTSMPEGMSSGSGVGGR